MIIKKIENQLIYLFRYFHQIWVFILFKISSKNIKYPLNTTIKSFKSIKTTDGGEIFIGENSHIENNTIIYSKNGHIKIGNNVYIGSGTQIISKNTIEIGDDCQIASYCVIRDSNHSIKANILIREQKDIIKKVVLGNDVWIGSHVCVLAGSTINNGAVIGAHSVVNNNIKSNAIAVGIPAKIIKFRK